MKVKRVILCNSKVVNKILARRQTNRPDLECTYNVYTRITYTTIVTCSTVAYTVGANLCRERRFAPPEYTLLSM